MLTSSACPRNLRTNSKNPDAPYKIKDVPVDTIDLDHIELIKNALTKKSISQIKSQLLVDKTKVNSIKKVNS
jgi:hypothetical protein